jgi:NosR/NirI family nitrous oxide reductase transcriptional regulator
MVADDSIVRSAIKVARRLELGGLTPEPEVGIGPRWEVNPEIDELVDWQTLTGEGAMRRLRLSIADINAAFEDSGDPVAAARPEDGDPEDDFIDLYVALVTIPSIGRSLLGPAEYANLQKVLKPDQQAILVAAEGRYSFKGSGYVRGGIFDRFQVIQGDESLRFRDRHHTRLGAVAAEGAPSFTDVDLFVIPEGSSFDPARSWRLDLLVHRATGPTRKSFLTFDMGYRPPERYLKKVAGAEPASGDSAGGEGGQAKGHRGGEKALDTPLWQRLWHQKLPEMAVLLVALGLLTVIFFVQDWLTKHSRLTERLRIGFLIFTLFGVGFYANAQLSVVNVMTFFNALVAEFRWDFFLKEPLVFILWCSVAAALLFWGRGAFCGWLCPFGALQELTNRLARLLKVPQVTVPWWLHERLWSLKYMIFLVLFAVSLYSLSLAEQLAEIEPFKTAIILKFQRDWPYVVFAVAVLTAGLFIERFYCRYLCPLGAALAIPGRLRMFDWLKRYRECGNPCQRCSNECIVGAIHPEGQINPNECHSCLHCQTLYHDDRRCPVMIQRRLKRERRQAMASKTLPPKAGAKTKEPLELADFLPQ